jgi:hypothetical protein
LVGGVANTGAMTTWRQFSEEAPELAAAVRARLEATKHHVLATLRADGSPRVSGSEVDFHGDDLTLGSMWEAVKARDLQRDGRFALHANPGDGTMAGGDAKLSGVAVELDDDGKRAYEEQANPPTPYHLFRLDLHEVVLTSLHPDGDRLVIETWRPGGAVRRTERR